MTTEPVGTVTLVACRECGNVLSKPLVDGECPACGSPVVDGDGR